MKIPNSKKNDREAFFELNEGEYIRYKIRRKFLAKQLKQNNKK